jgi:hypothetical protein
LPSFGQVAAAISIFGIAALSFLGGAAVIHFQVPPFEFLDQAFRGAQAWHERGRSPFSLREGALSPVILGCGSDPHPEARTSKNADTATITIVRRNISVASSTIDDGYGSATAIPSWKPVKAIQVLKSIFGEMRCT